jgi:hypothetical protein
VRLVHGGWRDGTEWDESRRMHDEGWAFFLGNLKAYLEHGEDGRPAALGMQTATA